MPASPVFDRFDIAIVPFPFTDSANTKKRPVVILSDAAFNEQSKHIVALMITSKSEPAWPLDTAIKRFKSAGLSTASTMRMKIFTIDARLVIKKIGRLSAADIKSLEVALDQLWNG